MQFALFSISQNFRVLTTGRFAKQIYIFLIIQYLFQVILIQSLHLNKLSHIFAQNGFAIDPVCCIKQLI